MSGQTAVARTPSPPGGDERSLEALMSQYAARVYRLALSITRNTADAEEVVQDVFFTVFRKSATFEGRSAFGSWLYRICINTALNRRRGKRARVHASLDALAQSHDDGVRLARATLDRSQTPDQRLLGQEARAVLSTALDALPDHYRTVVTLRDVEELPSADVVEVLHESPPCVKTRLHRARLVLRARLASYFSDRRPRPSAPASWPCASRGRRARLP
jgi:RNA polymerase sigma-70 factor (ECF subfamily)